MRIPGERPGSSTETGITAKEPAMPRIKRLDPPGIARHIIQRGNNRQACFFQDYDRTLYLALLGRFAQAHGCAVHAYVLMGNHVHLLATPAATGAVAGMMQSLGRDYVRHVNLTQGRCGTLWQGRYFSSPVDSDRYLLACYRYIELNPVRAGMVALPEDYRWSSCAGNALGEPDPLLTAHEVFTGLAGDPVTRRSCYRGFLHEIVPQDELAAIRLHSAQQRALGTEQFQSELQATLQRPVAIGRPGRPRRSREIGL
jgi:putative transposase